MNTAVIVPIVVALLAAFGGTGIATLVLLPKTKQQMDATSTFQLTQSVVLASQEVDRLREKVAKLTFELDEQRALRMAAEQRVQEWSRLYPPPPHLDRPPGTP